MNINPNEIVYISPFKRCLAASIDGIIVTFARILAGQILGTLWLNTILQQFMLDFNEHFGTEAVKNNQEHIYFFMNHQIFKASIIFIIILFSIGTFYHIYFNSSKWQGTIGKRLLKIIMIRNDNYQKLTLLQACEHYFLSILPGFYIFYLMIYKSSHHIEFAQAIVSGDLNIILGILSILWVQIMFLTKKKNTLYDMISKVVFIEGKTESKKPW